MDKRVSEIIVAHPIGQGLDAFRGAVSPLVRQRIACHEIPTADLQDLCLDLVLTLQMIPASRQLPSSNGSKNLFSDLAQLGHALNSRISHISRISPLLESILDHEDDEIIWANVYKFERHFAAARCEENLASEESSIQLSDSSAAASADNIPPGKSAPQRARLPKASVKILKRWCEDHQHNPYPTSEEKIHLMTTTGLSSSQLSTWFVNARRRGKKKQNGHTDVEGRGPSNVQIPQPIGIPEDWKRMNPLDRWRHSPPEYEAASLSSISRAVSQRESNLVEAGFGADSFLLLASSTEGSRSSSSATSSQNSHYNLSADSLDGIGGQQRRRRRHKRKGVTSRILKGGSKNKPYQCTFCTDSFSTKFDWTRHERTLHLSLETWTCARFGPMESGLDESDTMCAFCGREGPDTKHFESHDYEECKNKSATARTFYRKDHLQQHLRLVHHVDQFIPSMQRWKTEITRVRCRCGFCGTRFLEWSERNEHIANHFRTGAHMRDWSGCRGLDPAIALLVQNAMPPYLIGADTTAVVPFSATESTRAVNGLVRQPTTFESLTERLGQFVKRTRETGVIITDELLQKEARCIVYEIDDPWNQTAADNPQWLSLFKQGHGIESGVGSTTQRTMAVTGSPNMNTPWTVEDWMNPTIRNTMLDGVGDSSECATASVLPNHTNLMPFAWQSPECLAEFRERNLCEQARGFPGMCGATFPDGVPNLLDQNAPVDLLGTGGSLIDHDLLLNQTRDASLLDNMGSAGNNEWIYHDSITDLSTLGLGTAEHHSAPLETPQPGGTGPALEFLNMKAFE